MDESLVFSKTDAGAEVLQTRSSILSQKHRRCLILMDGQRSAFELSAFFRPGEFVPIVKDLIERGYVVVPAGGMADLDEGPQSDFPRIAQRQFSDILKAAIGELAERCGPGGDPLAMDLSRCDTPERLRIALRGAERVLQELIGPDEAQEFVRRVGKQLMG
jgi:hypothetical protein